MKETPYELAEAYNQASRAESAWKKEKERLGDVIRELAGEETELAVNGVKVFTYEYTKGFQGAAFAREYPELVEQFTVIRAEHALDGAALKATFPDIYRKFQSRQLRQVS